MPHSSLLKHTSYDNFSISYIFLIVNALYKTKNMAGSQSNFRFKRSDVKSTNKVIKSGGSLISKASRK
jgi:hypothetical protein